MKFHFLFTFILISSLLSAQTRYDVTSSSEFDMAQDLAVAGDSIVWESGVYPTTRMDIYKDGLTITAEPYGTVLFKGASRVVIEADDITFSGIQYIGGNIGNLNVFNIYGSDVLITHVNIQNYTSHKYLVVDEDSRRTTVSHCNFENRLNLDDKNILSILVDNEPGYHKIQHCSFKNFNGIGADQGIEPIRIGVSSQGELDSRTLVEYCYFTRCNGDGEIISHKSRQNVYRYNTFENNPLSELVLRHGDEGIVYGNFFLNSRGGIRIREGSHHFIYNNYFEGIENRALWLMNDPVDPLTDVHIYHNTFVNSEEIRLGGDGNNPPSNVTIANNVFAFPLEDLFDSETGSETWINNLSFGELGINQPSTGLTDTDPRLYENTDGFFQPESNSPVIASASDGYPVVPLYEGMDYDNDLLFDLMQESRPVAIADKAIGASEFSTSVNVQPHATEMNTGPSYLFDNLVDYIAANVSQLYIGKDGESRSAFISSNVDWTIMESENWISTDLLSGSGDTQVQITIDQNLGNVNRSGTVTIIGATDTVTIEVFQDATLSILENIETKVLLFPNPTDGKIKLSNLPLEINGGHIEIINLDGKIIYSKEYSISNHELITDLDKLMPGTYLLNMKFVGQNGKKFPKLTRKIVKK